MQVYQVIASAIVLGTAVPIGLHQRLYQHFNLHQGGLAFFLWLNVIIALWEFCLFFRIDYIEAQHGQFRAQYRGRELDRVKDFFGRHLTLPEIFSPTTWAEIWSSYALFDDSYASRKSFGFFIDVGNGFSTLIPSLLFLYGSLYELISARAMGLILLVLNYQMWYGTIVYFGSYLFNRRYAGHRALNIGLFVGFANGLWLLFPLWAMGVALTMIYTNSYAILR